MEKKFKCKMEEVPVIAGYIFTSFETDKDDFVGYSPVFADPYIGNAWKQQRLCLEIVKSGDVLQLQKAVKKQIEQKLQTLKVSMNQLEGYLKLSKGNLDIHWEDFGLQALRAACNDKNTAKIGVEGHSLITNLKRNEAALKAVGMSAETMDGWSALIGELELLDTNHNDKKNERGRVSDDNIGELNKLWDIVLTIADAGKAIYKGVDEVKLREYTISHLQKRVNNSKKNGSEDKTDSADNEAK